MTHLPVLPIVLPLAAAILQLAFARHGIGVQRRIAFAAMAGLVPTAVALLAVADRGTVLVYALGDWPAPYGIVLAVDRLGALMVGLTTVLAAACLLFAVHGEDARGRHFHPLFQLQVAGIHGAFLTGDLFNLFVFFEVMLLASYVLLAHGGGLARTRAGIAYVVLNLTGSALFLVGLGLLYGTLGTLNLADVALQLQAADPARGGLARAGCALVVTVFVLKAALLPLSFWLPHTYAAAAAPVAALFAIMTKVGVVALLRVQAVALAPAAVTADLLQGWLLPLALATIAMAALGALAAGRLQSLSAYLVLGSAGTLLFVPVFASAAVTSAGLYYLLQSTLATAAFFLLGELVAAARPGAGDRFAPGRPVRNTALALGFLLLAAGVAGLPPLAGFLGKVMLLRSVQDAAGAPGIWLALLLSGFVAMAALARGGSLLFWESRTTAAGHPTPAGPARAWAAGLLVATGPLLVLLAQPVSAYAARAAAQLHAPGAYVQEVLAATPIRRERRP